MGYNIFEACFYLTFIIAGLSFLLTFISAIEAFYVTKGRFNRYLSYTDIYKALINSLSLPFYWVLRKSVPKINFQSPTPLAYSYIGLFLSFITSVLGGIIWFIFFREITEAGSAPVILFFWYISVILKNLGLNAFHLRIIAAQLAQENL